MRFLAFSMAILAHGLLAAMSLAGDPPTINRTIGKEPAFQSKAPKYGLLVFGPEGKDRVWLVCDGDTLYVDRNGNGDLTDPGEKVAAEKRPGHDPEVDGYNFDVGELTVDGRKHKGLSVSFVPLKRYARGSLGDRPDVKAALAKDPNATAVTLSAHVEVPGMKGGGVGGRVYFLAGPIDLTGVFQFADRPAQAPVVRLGGPLEVTFYAERPSLRVGRGSEFTLVVGTPGIGPGTFAMIGYEGTVPAGAKPMAEITCAPAKAGAPPAKQRFDITGRC
jgi:hypothetical protein